MRARRGEGGFTLTEMMVVVAMIAILAALAVSRFDTAPRAGDAATTMAALIRETARKAVEGGPTRLVITNGDQVTFSVEKLVEEPDTWVVLGTRTMPKGLEASGFTDQAVLDDGGTPAVTLGTAEIRCYPDGVCEGATVYFQGRRGDHARVAVLPLGGAPVTYRSW